MKPSSEVSNVPAEALQAPEYDKPHDECGVFGIYSAVPKEVIDDEPTRAARAAFRALRVLQHRGQESAGIAVYDGTSFIRHADAGLVDQVFDQHVDFARLRGRLAIGHVRYSTTGGSTPDNAQPRIYEAERGFFSLAHNGNLTNTHELRQWHFGKRGAIEGTDTSDTVLAAHYLAGGKTPHWEERIEKFMRKAEGAYSMTMLTKEALFAFRDPKGFRPLSYGVRGGNEWAVASESAALRSMGFRDVTEVRAGELLRIDENGPQSIFHHPDTRPAFCSFEHVYFARPDSKMNGERVQVVRKRSGRILAAESPVEADVVVGVPESSIPAAIGFALESGIELDEGFTKTRYAMRSFIQPTDEERQNAIEMKQNPIPEVFRDKRVVLIDDSIVRGNTLPKIIRQVKDCGAREVHVRIASPAVTSPCFMGVDMATADELISRWVETEALRQQVGADSLAFLSEEGLLEAMGSERDEVCMACFNGEYPLDLPERDEYSSATRGEINLRAAAEGEIPLSS